MQIVKPAEALAFQLLILLVLLIVLGVSVRFLIRKAPQPISGVAQSAANAASINS